MLTSPLFIVILAAGKGTRMKSEKAKVLHEVFYEPMASHVLESTLPLQPKRTVVVIGHQKEEVKKALSSFNCEFAIQQEQLGTGHAVLAAESIFNGEQATVMILCGDTPLIRKETLEHIYSFHLDGKNDLTLLTTILDDPTNYGRVLSDDSGNLLGIVEQKDASESELAIQEINAGIYCVDSAFLFSALKKVGTDNKQGEVYLTDIVGSAVEAGLTVKKYTTPDPIEVLGVNSRLELSEAQRELQHRRNLDLMSTGVSMIGPESIRVCPESTVMNDTLLESGVHIYGGSFIGSSCLIEQGTVLKNCTLGDNVQIGAGSHREKEVIGDNQNVPPLSKTS